MTELILNLNGTLNDSITILERKSLDACYIYLKEPLERYFIIMFVVFALLLLLILYKKEIKYKKYILVYLVIIEICISIITAANLFYSS